MTDRIEGGARLAGPLERLARAGPAGGVVAAATVLVLGSAAALVLFLVAGLVLWWPLLEPAETAVLAAVEAARGPAATDAMHNITVLGDGFVVTVLGAVAGLLLWLGGRRWAAWVPLAAGLGGYGVGKALKALYDRPRQGLIESLTEHSSASYPSGHAMTAAAMWLACAWLVGRLTRGPRAGAVKAAAWASAAVLAVAVAVSRVYLGAHYATDAVAGLLAGALWAAVVAAAAETARRATGERPRPTTPAHGA